MQKQLAQFPQAWSISKYLKVFWIFIDFMGEVLVLVFLVRWASSDIPKTEEGATFGAFAIIIS